MARKVILTTATEKMFLEEGETTVCAPPLDFKWKQKATFRRYKGTLEGKAVEVIIWEGSDKRE